MMTKGQIELLHRYLDSAITANELEMLEALLRSSQEARAMLRSLATIDAKWQDFAAEQQLAEDSGRSSHTPSHEKPVLPLWIMISCMAAAVALGFYGWFGRPAPVFEPLEPGVARIIRVEGSTLSNGRSELSAGDELYAGDTLSLQAGVVELAFRESGVHMVATGPLAATLESTQRMFLQNGEVKLVVPPQGTGFVVETYERKITDLGTKFVVKASQEGSDILVLDGLVNVDDRSETPEQYLYEGDSASISREGHMKVRSVDALDKELPISMMPFSRHSLQGVFLGFEDLPDRPPNEPGVDRIGSHVLPLVKSGFQDRSCLAALKSSDPIRFSGIVGAHDTFVERNGFPTYAPKWGWLALYSGTVTPPQAGRYRFWGYADNHLVLGIDGKLVFEGGRYDSTFRMEQLVPRSNHPFLPCLVSQAGFAAGPWLELDGSAVSLNLLFGERAGSRTSGLLLVEYEGADYETTSWGQPKWPLFLTEMPVPSEIVELMRLRTHMEEKLQGSFSVDSKAVWAGSN